MKEKAYFITGTDTNIGKTYVATRLLTEYQQQGKSAIGLKPIASGAIQQHNALVNEDALLLQQASSINIPLPNINPFVFEPAIAPHIAAMQANITLSCQTIKEEIMRTMGNYVADHYLIEGAGGLLVPINDTETIADLIKLLNLPIILIVGIKLGCINHALLTNDYILQHKLPFAGWIANCLDANCAKQNAIIETLNKKMAAPCLRVMPLIS